MDIETIVTSDFVEVAPETTVSRAAGAFGEPSVAAIVVIGEDGYEGVVTRRQMAVSHQPPSTKLRSMIWSVPRVSPNEDIREVAQLMLDSDSSVLPVFDGARMRGVVTAAAVLRAVRSALDAVTVADAQTTDLVTVTPTTTFGEALHLLRDHRISHLPVLDEGDLVGILSLHDVVAVSAREENRSQGGHTMGFDGNAGSGSSGGYRSHGGFGAREGDVERMLDLPVRDIRSTAVETITRNQPLGMAVERMLEHNISSLVVEEGGSVCGILTKRDALDALTWEAEGHRAVQMYGTDLMDDLTYDEVVRMVEGFDDRDAGMSVLDAKVHLHEHSESLRGTSLVLARVRLSTDRGLFIGTGEGYGAGQAVRAARDVLERRIRDAKTHGRNKKHPDEAFWEKRFGWLLEE